MLSFLKPIFKLQFLFVILAVIVGVYYQEILAWHKNFIFTTEAEIPINYESDKQIAETLFTKAELAKYNGENGAPLYLALLGDVFDVTKGLKHYGPGCSYNFFIGRDASVSFITGEFENFVEDEADDVVVLKLNDLLGLENWKNFYHKDYAYVGKLIGRFYDNSGALTSYHHKFLALLDQAKQEKIESDRSRVSYPDCNIQWNAETSQTRVWCTNSSGGKERDWAGYPRKLFELGRDTFRCACVHQDKLDATDVMIKSYDNCEPLATECFYKVD
ncbi:neuferricin homolog [Teleopsis dalmanni]|uniref:neuferricin homolog n=1 Tax=Teleopsis dalmanni TaxID=139649 RepID=UPI0018CDCE43|nr:neuferricin homolog [Teleopsis dalmanni]